MESFSVSVLALWAGIHRSPVNSPHKDQWRGALMFSLICAWINGWVNNGEAGDLRRHRSHYGTIVMIGLQVLQRLLHFQRNQPKPHLWRTVAVLGTCMLITPGWNMGHIAICLWPKSESGMKQDSSVPYMVHPWHWYLFIPRRKINSFMITCQKIGTGEKGDGLAYIATPKVVFPSYFLPSLPCTSLFN